MSFDKFQRKSEMTPDEVNEESFQEKFRQFSPASFTIDRGIKMLLYGPEGSGKTQLAESSLKAPQITGNLYFVDTEMRAGKLAELYLTKEEWKRFYLFECAKLTEDTFRLDTYASWLEFEEAMGLLGGRVKAGDVVVVDTITELKIWASALVSKKAVFFNQKTGKPLQFEWGIANEAIHNLMMQCQVMRAHVILTSHADDIWIEQVNPETGRKKGVKVPDAIAPRVSKGIPHMVDFICRASPEYKGHTKDIKDRKFYFEKAYQDDTFRQVVFGNEFSMESFIRRFEEHSGIRLVSSGE